MCVFFGGHAVTLHKLALVYGDKIQFAILRVLRDAERGAIARHQGLDAISGMRKACKDGVCGLSLDDYHSLVPTKRDGTPDMRFSSNASIFGIGDPRDSIGERMTFWASLSINRQLAFDAWAIFNFGRKIAADWIRTVTGGRHACLRVDLATTGARRPQCRA